MNEVAKPWWQSRGVIGSVITVLATIAGLFGYTVSSEDTSALIENIALIAAAGGGILSFIGRIFAKRPIK